MSHRTSSRTRFAFVRRYPFDLAAVSIGAVLAFLVVTAFESGNGLRLFVTMPLSLFLPGYALVSVLFPARERDARETAATAAEARPRGIDITERVGLGFVLSLAIVPLAVLILPITGWGLTTASVAATLARDNRRRPTGRRATAPDSGRRTVQRLPGLEPGASPRRRKRGRDGVVGTARGRDRNGGRRVTRWILLPVAGGGYTELALYSEDEDGELVAGALPSEVEPGESIPLTVSIENQEGDQQRYTVVVQEQVIEDGEVVERTELRRIDATVSDGATASGGTIGDADGRTRQKRSGSVCCSIRASPGHADERKRCGGDPLLGGGNNRDVTTPVGPRRGRNRRSGSVSNSVGGPLRFGARLTRSMPTKYCPTASRQRYQLESERPRVGSDHPN